jgi:ACS family sodium-dependent inorganic phosphate cotransporter
MINSARSKLTMNLIPKNWPKRYTMMVLLLAAILLCYVDRVIVSLAAIEMQKEFGWSDSEKGLVLSTFFLGYLVMQSLGGIFSNRFGGRNIFLAAVLLWSLFTILTPVSAYISFSMLLFARFMLGIGEGASFPAAYNLIHGWMPTRERSRSIGGMNAASAIGTVATLLVAGKIIEIFGWPSVFYLFGSMGVIWGMFWLRKVPTNAEKPDDASDKAQVGAKRKIPWKILLTHPAILTVYFASVCVGAISYTMASWLPSYFVDTFDFTIIRAGFYSILPWGVVAFTTVAAGVFADNRIASGATPVHVRKKVTATGLFLIIICCLALTQVSGALLAVAVICGIFAGLGILVNGYSPTAAEMLPSHGDVLFGFAAAFGSMAAAFMVTLTGVLLDRTNSYDALWLGLAGLSMVAMIIYLAFARADSLED